MQIKSLSLAGFMGWRRPMEVTLPPAGLILVTGQNGAGKSSLVEGASYAAWGKTLRGTDPKRSGETGQAVVVTADPIRVARGWGTSGRTHLTADLVGAEGEEPWQFESTAKCQEHVTGVLGEWDTWRRSCVFSSVDDMSFATATDAERKRLLEDLLGLRQFDRASEACRVDLRAAVAISDLATRAAEVARAREHEVTRTLHQVKEMVALVPKPVDLALLHGELAHMRLEQDALEELARQDEVLRREYQAAKAKVDAERGQLIRQQHGLGGDSCLGCNRPWADADHRAAHRARIQADLDALVTPDPPTLEDRSGAINNLRTRQHEVAGMIKSATTDLDRYQRAQAQLTKAQDSLLEAQIEATRASESAQHNEAQAAKLAHVDRVLGTRGARAHILGGALRGLEAAANVWLNRIARVDAPLSLHLSAYTEKKTGGIMDAIALQVTGAGGGKGYKAASGGERRRIDVALMLALAEVSHQATGKTAPTMFFDEVFDALDADGVAAVVEAVQELAMDRCVLVVSHSAELMASLVPDLHFEVRDDALIVR